MSSLSRSCRTSSLNPSRNSIPLGLHTKQTKILSNAMTFYFHTISMYLFKQSYERTLFGLLEGQIRIDPE